MAKHFSIAGMVIGLILILVGLATTVPDDIIQTNVRNRERGGYERYVGGDAYNFMIEASIRSGEIAGRTASRAIYMTGGAILFTGSLMVFGVFLEKEKWNKQPEGASLPLEPAHSGEGGGSSD